MNNMNLIISSLKKTPSQPNDKRRRDERDVAFFTQSLVWGGGTGCSLITAVSGLIDIVCWEDKR